MSGRVISRYNPGMLSLLFALIGLVVGAVLNVLADDLPAKAGVHAPHCPQCDYRYGVAGWSALGRVLFHKGQCPQCEFRVRRRAITVEIITPLIFAYLPLILTDWPTLIFVALYVAVLILIIVIDLEHRLILHAVTFPATALALVGSFFVNYTNIWLAILGAVLGFIVFLLFFLLGQFLFGPGALGFGDVTLSMTMGAMLGFPYIIFALVIGIILGGVFSLLLILSRRRSRRSYMAYGPYLALGGLIMAVWGPQLYNWYVTL